MSLANFLFYTIAALTAGCAIAVVVTGHIVRAAAWLLFTLAGVAGLFFLLGADFVGATQVLVYVGGTLVLVVFGVMLTAQGPFISMKTGAGEWAVSTVVGLSLFAVLTVALVTKPIQITDPLAPQLQGEQAGLPDSPPELPRSATLGLSLLGMEEATSKDSTLTGGPLRKERRRVAYLLPFEIVSVHLLVVLVGAAYLARTKRRKGATP
jgi:NADH-quinone oxidoreductase subunit J